jgi:alpha-tubulin suppressor-like RCC1 family protein
VSSIVEGSGSQNCVNSAYSGLQCFGPDGALSGTLFGSTNMPETIGGTSACIRLGNGVDCWGDNSYGQLGDGTNTSHSTLSLVVGLAGPTAAISLGYTHACALLTNGTVQCWGDNSYGQIGDGTTTNRNVATTVPGLSGITAVTAGFYRTCAIGSGGAMWCWGSSHGAGAIGDGTTSDRHVPTAVYGLTAAVEVVVGNGHTCARLSNGTVWCWGDNTHGAVGDGTTTNHTMPWHVPALTGVATIRVTEASTCALLTGGAVKCWGYNAVGAVGDGTTVDRTSPTQVVALTSGATALAHGGYFFCALVGGVVECWGGGASPYVRTPKPVEGLF